LLSVMGKGKTAVPRTITPQIHLDYNNTVFTDWTKHGVPQYRCVMCDILCVGNDSLDRHWKGKKHLDNNLMECPPSVPKEVTGNLSGTPAPTASKVVVPSLQAQPKSVVVCPRIPVPMPKASAAIPVAEQEVEADLHKQKRGRGSMTCTECYVVHNGECPRRSKTRRCT